MIQVQKCLGVINVIGLVVLCHAIFSYCPFHRNQDARVAINAALKVIYMKEFKRTLFSHKPGFMTQKSACPNLRADGESMLPLVIVYLTVGTLCDKRQIQRFLPAAISVKIVKGE